MIDPESAVPHEIEVLGAAPPPDQLAQPLDYIFAEHFRQRVLCNVLDTIASGRSTERTLLQAAICFLKTDFAPHVCDEEEDLFPLLRRRAEPDDEVVQLIDRLSEEHAADKLDAQEIIEGLQGLLRKTGRVPATLAKLLRRFAANERHHLTVENAIILPLARLRLTREDLWSLGHRMAQRRGLPFPEVVNAV